MDDAIYLIGVFWGINKTCMSIWHTVSHVVNTRQMQSIIVTHCLEFATLSIIIFFFPLITGLVLAACTAAQQKTTSPSSVGTCVSILVCELWVEWCLQLPRKEGACPPGSPPSPLPHPFRGPGAGHSRALAAAAPPPAMSLVQLT